MKMSERLRKARGFLTKKSWIKGDSALNAQGQTVLPTAPSAVKFCALGALSRAIGRRGPLSSAALFDGVELLNKAAGCGIADFNDRKSTKLIDVKKAFTRAAALAAKKGD